MSLYNTGITDFFFLADAPNIQTVCLPRVGNKTGESADNARIAKIVREICQKKEKLINNLEKQLQQLSNLLFPNQTYNFNQLKQEITRLKYQELSPQTREQKTEFEKLVADAKLKVGEGSFSPIIDLFLEAQKQIVEQEKNNLFSQGQLSAYQKILQTKLTQEELQNLLNKQKELLKSEQHLKNLQQNQEQLTQQIEISPK